MGVIYRHHRLNRILHELQLSFTVNLGKTAKRLRQIVQKIPPSLDVVFRVDAKKFCAVWQGFNFCLRVRKLYAAGGTHDREEVVRIAAGLRLVVFLIEIQHGVVSL